MDPGTAADVRGKWDKQSFKNRLGPTQSCLLDVGSEPCAANYPMQTQSKQQTVSRDEIYSQANAVRLFVYAKSGRKWMGCETVLEHQMSF